MPLNTRSIEVLGWLRTKARIEGLRDIEKHLQPGYDTHKGMLLPIGLLLLGSVMGSGGGLVLWALSPYVLWMFAVLFAALVAPMLYYAFKDADHRRNFTVFIMFYAGAATAIIVVAGLSRGDFQATLAVLRSLESSQFFGLDPEAVAVPLFVLEQAGRGFLFDFPEVLGGNESPIKEMLDPVALCWLALFRSLMGVFSAYWLFFIATNVVAKPWLTVKAVLGIPTRQENYGRGDDAFSHDEIAAALQAAELLHMEHETLQQRFALLEQQSRREGKG